MAKTVAEITAELERGIEALMDSQHYREYLHVMSKFRNYSLNNTILIAMQRPDATLVHGYRAWQTDFKRHVKKGEKGIQIIAPTPIKVTSEKEKADAGSNESADCRDKEESVSVIQRYKVTTVFDVSQTEGEPLPQLGKGNLTADFGRCDEFMTAIKQLSPVSVRFENIPSGANGYYSRTAKEIVIQSGLSESQTMKTAIHEVTHAILHDDNSVENQGIQKDRLTREVEAESVAFTVCNFYRLDTSDYSFPYITSWSSGRDLKELRQSMETIRQTARDLIDGIGRRLTPVQEERAVDKVQREALPRENQNTTEKAERIKQRKKGRHR